MILIGGLVWSLPSGNWFIASVAGVCTVIFVQLLLWLRQAAAIGHGRLFQTACVISAFHLFYLPLGYMSLAVGMSLFEQPAMPTMLMSWMLIIFAAALQFLTLTIVFSYLFAKGVAWLRSIIMASFNLAPPLLYAVVCWLER